METVLPVEIIYKISIHIPFHSHMWILSKDTRKYWEDRFINFDDVTFSDLGRPIDFAVLGNKDLTSKKYLIVRILQRVKYISVKGNIDMLEPIFYYEKDVKINMEQINFSGLKITESFLHTILSKKIKALDYICNIHIGDRDILVSHSPHYADLYNLYIRSIIKTDHSKVPTNVWYIKINRDRVITHISDDVVYLPREKNPLTYSEHLLIWRTIYPDSIGETVQIICTFPNIKSCTIVSKSPHIIAAYETAIIRTNITSEITLK